MVMVQRFKRILFCFCLLPAIVMAEVEVTTNINIVQAGENNPIEVVVTVVRDAGLKVDVSSFFLKNEPIKVEHIGDSSQSSISIINGRRRDSHTTTSQYRFFLPGKPAGLYVLPPVSVRVDGTFYSSKSSTYQVQAGEVREDFRLEASVEGPSPLYPRQRATFVYRIYFKDNIELTVEKLPLFDLEGFRMIGRKKINTYVQNGYNVQEIAQDVEAMDPGVFHVEESIIEGFAYNEDFFGRRSYRKPRLRSIADPITIVVEAFPEEGKPETFFGAVGTFQLDVEMLTKDTVSIGDKVELSIRINGSDVSTVQLPNIENQEGFRGLFRFSDLPPVGEIEKSSKHYILELRPLSENIQEIPSIEFSYFDPYRKRYQTLRSRSIPIVVKALREPESQEALQPQIVHEKEPQKEPIEEEVVDVDEDWRKNFADLGTMEIAGNYQLEESNLKQYFWMTWNAVYVIPVGSGILALQVQLRRYWSKRTRKQRRKRGRVLFMEAIRQRDLGQLEAAFLLRLLEKGKVSRRFSTSEELPQEEGVIGDVRKFLLALEERRFAGTHQTLDKELIDQAKKIFERIL